MATVWQQVGVFVQTLANFDHGKMQICKDAGIRWFAPVIYGDDVAGPSNRDLLPQRIEEAKAYNMYPVGWFNLFNDPDREKDAVACSGYVYRFKLKAAIFDMELQYKYPEYDPNGMPEFFKVWRIHRPTLQTGVSSYGFMDRAMIWTACKNQKIRYLPQSYYLYDGKYDPSWCMNDIKTNRFTDPNLGGIPLNYVHFTISDIEGHSIQEGINRIRKAKTYGFSQGYSIYDGEHLTAADGGFVNMAPELRSL